MAHPRQRPGFWDGFQEHVQSLAWDLAGEWTNYGDRLLTRRERIHLWVYSYWEAFCQRMCWQLCMWEGHQYANVACDPENGTEEIQCMRCGVTEYVQF